VRQGDLPAVVDERGERGRSELRRQPKTREPLQTTVMCSLHGTNVQLMEKALILLSPITFPSSDMTNDYCKVNDGTNVTVERVYSPLPPPPLLSRLT
jgi:hypothetical protein